MQEMLQPSLSQANLNIVQIKIWKKILSLSTIFLGYLFPGMLTLLIVIHITYLKEPSSISDYFSIAGFMHTFKNELSIEWWKSTLIL